MSRRTTCFIPRAALAILAVALAAPRPASALERPARPTSDLETEAWLNTLPEAEIQPAVDELLAAVGTTSYRSFSPGAFVVRNPDGEYYLFENLTPGAIDSHGALVGNPCYYAPLRLPQGATVTGFVVWAREPDAGDLYGALHRKSLGSLGDSTLMATVASSGSQASLRIFTDLTITDATIENRYFYYYLELCLPGDDSELHGVYVSYAQ